MTRVGNKHTEASSNEIYDRLVFVRDHMSSDHELQERASRRRLMDCLTSMAGSLPDDKGSANDAPAIGIDGVCRIDLTQGS